MDAALVGAFTNALGRDRRGQVSSDVSGRTKSNRRSALRAFFAATSAAGWTSEDPAAIVELFNRKGATRTPRPLSDDEAERVRFLADDNPAWVRPAAVALMLCGAWASEAAFLAPGDFDPETRAVALPGMVGRLPRSVVLDERSARVVANRLAYLRLQVPEPAGLLFAAPRASHRQHIKVFNVARSALTRAGLDPDHEVTPASLTLWAARRVLDETGRVEEAARLIGAQSLDQTARDLRWDWNARAEEAPSS